MTRTVIKDGKVTQTRTQDERPYLDRNKAMLNSAPGRFDKKPKIRAIASIPMVAYCEIMTKMEIPPHRWFQLTQDEKKRRNKYLNKPEYRYLRTAPGKL